MALMPLNRTLYFVCSNSDDNLLKNIELFDKLSLRFHGRVLFIKDVIGSNEICCWAFYGHGAKITEVCCTSIVYGTDKKHTKVMAKSTSVSVEYMKRKVLQHCSLLVFTLEPDYNFCVHDQAVSVF